VVDFSDEKECLPGQQQESPPLLSILEKSSSALDSGKRLEVVFFLALRLVAWSCEPYNSHGKVLRRQKVTEIDD
jgi:hypothetical protein